MGLFKSASSKHLDNMMEEHLYGTVVNEISNNQISEGLYAKALVQSNGDKSKAEVKYIALRVAALKTEAAAKGEALVSKIQEEKRVAKEQTISAPPRNAPPPEDFVITRGTKQVLWCIFLAIPVFLWSTGKAGLGLAIPSWVITGIGLAEGVIMIVLISTFGKK